MPDRAASKQRRWSEGEGKKGMFDHILSTLSSYAPQMLFLEPVKSLENSGATT